MKSVLTLCAGFLLGGVILWSVQQIAEKEEPESLRTPTLSGEEKPGSAESTLRSADPASREEATRNTLSLLPDTSSPGGVPAVLGGPIFNQEEPETVAASTTPENGLGEASDLRGIVDVNALQQERELARATFDIGERDRAKRMMERFYDLWKDTESLDLTPEVERLLKVENEFSRRREYSAYLLERQSSGDLYREQLRRGVGSLAKADEGRAAAFAAWEDLTLAYELARSREQRHAVLTHLQPFLKRMVFVGRSPAVLTTYTVKSGDNLSTIADHLDTTVGSIRRLNGLTSNVIQPRQRLRLLPGKVRVHVDKSDFRLWLTVDDRFLFERPVGLGRDDATPTGTFVIRVKEKNPSWWKPGQTPIPPGDPRNILGSRWLGFADTEDFSGYGIHGTTDPSSIGRASSAGCVRLAEEDVQLLYDFVPYGAEVVIRS